MKSKNFKKISICLILTIPFFLFIGCGGGGGGKDADADIPPNECGGDLCGEIPSDQPKDPVEAEGEIPPDQPQDPVEAEGEIAPDQPQDPVEAEGEIPEDVPSDGTEGDGGGPEALCLSTGGMVGTANCCLATGDFPNTCLPGPCSCSPDNSHEVSVCNCPTDHCFDPENGCIPNPHP